MAAFPDRQIILELVVRSAHPALLQGLDDWLQLGLLSDEAVRQICQEQLSCPLPDPVAAPAEESFIDPFAEESFEEAAPALPANRFAQIMQSFMAEVSVLWLLFLGVFMVVVSSGVLAATQWRNFSTVGQYLILLGYTLAFWVASVLTGRRSTLVLTSRMLQITTLLIIPVNFWMMDGFRLLTNISGFVVATIAALTLTAITILILKPTFRERGNTWLTTGTAIALSWLHWGWSWASFPLVATYLGTVGAALALVVQDEAEVGRGGGGEEEDGGGEEDAGTRGCGDAEISDFQLPIPDSRLPPPSPLSSGFIAVAFATLLLISRAFFVAKIPVTQLGLAAGICGWLLCWLSRHSADRAGWARAGAGLLIAGWLATVTVTPPWQAIAISGLTLWLLIDYLQRSSRVQYLTAAFLVGLQVVWLLWRVIPADTQQKLINSCIQLAGSQSMPQSLLGLWFFPYILLTVFLAFRLRQWQQPILARYTEALALGLGIVLAILSAGNPLVRLLNLTLSTITLAVVTSKRTQSALPLVYLTHGTGLAAIASGIYQLFPNLSLRTWAAVLLVGMVIEWVFTAGVGVRSQEAGGGNRESGIGNRESGGESTDLELSASPRPRVPASSSPPPSPPSLTLPAWQQSAWHFGLILSAISYFFLYEMPWQERGGLWALAWLLTPIALTGLTYQRRFPPWEQTGWLSVLALVIAQPLIFDSSRIRLIGLGTTVVLMLLNTQQLQHPLPAMLTVGFGLAFAAATAWEVLGSNLTFELAINLIAVAVLSLWLLYSTFAHRRTVLATIYRNATHGWAIALAILTLLLLALANLGMYLGYEALNWQYASAAALLFVAVGYRIWQSLFKTGFYLLSCSLELLVISVIAFKGRSLDAIATSNLALGLGAQLLGDWWMGGSGNREAGIGRRGIEEVGSRELAVSASSRLRVPASLPPPPLSLHLIPLFYAAFSLLLQHRTFTASTGLYTVGASIVGIGIGRRQPDLRALTYISVLGISFGAYELLLYQLSQVRGRNPGDGIVLMAALAAFLAIALRLLQRWLIPYLRLIPRELRALAHLHWVLASIFLLGALTNSLSSLAQWQWLGIATTLSAYALITANRRWTVNANLTPDAQRPTPDSPSPPSPLTSWTYAGIVQSLFTLAYLLHLLLPDDVLIDWGGAIVAITAFVLYLAPWDAWGWQHEPWRRSTVLLPGVVILLIGWGSTIQSLLIVAVFYAWLAKAERQVRLSYISVLLADWAILRLFDQYKIAEPLWYAALLSASLLYVAQIDPGLRSPNDREKRHLLRSLATALICLTALYQSEVGIQGILPILVSLLSTGIALGFVIAGILLRVRAFLYVGTLAFIIQVLRQLWLFVNDYSLLLWAMGIALGLVFIWVAATFEARRTQISNLVQYWTSELSEWD